MSGKASSYNPAVMSARVSTAKAGGAALFANAAGTVSEILDPSKLNKAGVNVRECFDSDVSPNSTPIIIIFDGTGSMRGNPKLFAEKFAGLMTVMVKEQICPNPQIMFGQICDYRDPFVLQLGQFEADNKMDTALTSMVLVGGGSGSAPSHEAYDLVLWYVANHTKIDSWDKRREKGWLFIIGDEMTNEYVTPNYVKKVFGFDIPASVKTKDVIAEVRKRYHLVWIMPGGSCHWDDQEVRDHLLEYYGDETVYLEDPTAICETITGIIGAYEGMTLPAITSAITQMGGSQSAVTAASTAVVAYSQKAVAKGAKVQVEGGLLVSPNTAGKGANRL